MSFKLRIFNQSNWLNNEIDVGGFIAGSIEFIAVCLSAAIASYKRNAVGEYIAHKLYGANIKTA